MMAESNNEIFDMWHDFRKTLIYQDRFFNNHIILNHIKDIVSKNQITITKDEILYRARIYKDDTSFIGVFDNFIRSYNSNHDSEDLDIYSELYSTMMQHDFLRRNETNFWGYDEKDSHIPQNPDLVTAGRANPEKVKYLYLANEPMCSVAEVRPLINEFISIAEIIMMDNLNIVDLSYDSITRVEEEQKFLTYLLMNEYSKPNNSSSFDYITTQFISEFIKSLKYDGIKFNSSLYGRGRNFVIFNYEKCKPRSSKLYKLDSVCLDLKCVGPVCNLLGEEDLYHWKLEPYKKTVMDKLTERLKK